MVEVENAVELLLLRPGKISRSHKTMNPSQSNDERKVVVLNEW